jgi:uncharacterized protein
MSFIKPPPDMDSSSKSGSFRSRYGPTAVVAGASEGIGAQFSIQLAERGLDLFLVARRSELLEALAARLSEQHHVRVHCLPLDLASPDAAAVIAKQTQELNVGLFIYNAAFSAIGPFWQKPLEDHLTELDVNCRTPLSLAWAMIPRLVERGRGGLILMSSLSANQGSALISHYAATKAYNRLLAEGLWEELRPLGIDVLACCPGAVSTPNYNASLKTMANRMARAMPPEVVVAETLAVLGRQPVVIPGRMNRLAFFVMKRLLPGETAIRLMGSVLRNMYG